MQKSGQRARPSSGRTQAPCPPVRYARVCEFVTSRTGRNRHPVTPKQFAIVLEEWSAKGGAPPESIPHDYAITTAEEVNAVCRALSSNHIYAVDSIKTPALDNLLVFLQSVETPVASSVFRDKGLPLLRRILTDALDGPRVADSEDRVAGRRSPVPCENLDDVPTEG
jgi:hypothetical protein